IEQDQEQWGRVVGDVVGTVRTLTQPGQLAAPQLVQDLARFSVAEVVEVGRLQRRQRLEAGACQVRLKRQGLVGGDQAVAPKERHEPGQTRRRQRERQVLQGTETKRGEVDQ